MTDLGRGTVRTASRHSGTRTRLLTVLLLVLLYYSAYRYPLKINSSLTSPTYADTPLLLSAGKFLLLAALAVFFSGRRAHQQDVTSTRTPGLLAPLLLAGAIWFVGKGAVLASPIVIEIGFFWALTLLWLSRSDGFSASSLERTLAWFAGLSIVVELIQLLLFRTLGRLPALAYEGTVSIRFGSIWDDPNGFAFVIALLLPICAGRANGRWRSIAIQALLLLMLILTQSLTGIACSVCGIAFARVVMLSRRSPGGMLVFVAVGSAALALALSRFLASPLFAEFINLKRNSIDDHVTSASTVKAVGPAQLSGLSLDPVQPVESGWVLLATYLGVVGVVLVGVFGLWAIAAAASLVSRERRPLWEGCLAFFMAVMAGNANLPLVAIFPVNGLFFLLGACCILSLRLKTSPIDRGAGRQSSLVAGVHK